MLRKPLILSLSIAALAACGAPGDQPGGGNDASIDMIIEGDYVVTMDESRSIIEKGAVAIDEGLILDVGSATEIADRFTAEVRLDGAGRIVMPGLINGHSHAAMTLLRGVADDLDLMDWLQNYIFPSEVEFVDEEFVRIGTTLACWEMIRGGTTTFVDMYYYPDTIAAAVEACGLRAYVAATVIDQRSPDAESAADSLARGQGFVTRWQGRSGRITPIWGPHANYTLNAEQLAATRAAADASGVPVSIHMSESPFELEYSKQTYGATSIEFFDSIGFLDGPTIGAHVVWPTEAEIRTLAERQVGVIHNPTSNMKISSGISPVTEMIAAGIRVGLGTDGAASNNDLDMWEEMRLAALLQKVSTMDPKALSADTVLAMATRDGAAAIGLGDITGSLEIGKRADVIQVSFDDVHFVPTYNVVSHLVYVADEQDVAATVVDGRLLMQGDEFLTIDTGQVRSEATELAGRIRDALAARNP
jgi:5-methylthioadenosine/S-adenosylhomocysteine deaminase